MNPKETRSNRLAPYFMQKFPPPLQAIPILFAVDTIPDMVETVTNVTADMAVTTIANHHVDLSSLALLNSGSPTSA